MRQGFIEILLSNFRTIYGPVLAIVSLLVPLVLSFLFWQFGPTSSVSLGIVLVVGTFGVICLLLLLTLMFTFLFAALEMHKANGTRLPKVVKGMDPRPDTQTTLRCVLEPSQLFAQGHMVSFYSLGSQDVEELVGIGVVEDVQSDLKIHVTMLRVERGQEDFTQRLRQNNEETKKATLVRPGIARGYTDL